MRVERFLTDSARRFPDKTALVAGGRRLTFSDLDGMSDRLAAGLVRNGLRRGERVIVFMENAWEAVAAIWAVLKAGGVFSPVNPSTKPDKLAYILNNCRAAALVTHGKLATAAAAAVASAPSVRFSVVAGA
jgi:long-chain acyl-CoA synthetase